MDQLHNRTEAQAVADIVEKHVKPEHIELAHPDGKLQAPAIVLPKGLELKSVKALLDEYRTAPERRKGTAVLKDSDSFIAFVNRFKDAQSVIFADPDKEEPVLLAVLDYNEEEPNGKARFGQHRAQYDFPLSDEWTVWTAKDKDPMSQQGFAEFLEDHIIDVLDPSDIGLTMKEYGERVQATFVGASKLMELSRGLSVRVNSDVSQAQTLASGERTLHFSTQHTDEKGLPLKVPDAFVIAIPVFRGGALYQVAVRLRYRVQGPKLSWFFELARTDAVFDDAFKGACREAERETKCPLFYGTPEAV